MCQLGQMCERVFVIASIFGEKENSKASKLILMRINLKTALNVVPKA